MATMTDHPPPSPGMDIATAFVLLAVLLWFGAHIFRGIGWM